jgi:hypothetical protein
MVIAAVAVLAVVLRALSLVFVKRYVNRALADMGAYRGHVASIDLSLLRGGYTLHDPEIVKADGARRPSSPCQRWIYCSSGALRAGKVVGEAVMRAPVSNFVQAPSERESQYGTGVN